MRLRFQDGFYPLGIDEEVAHLRRQIGFDLGKHARDKHTEAKHQRNSLEALRLW